MTATWADPTATWADTAWTWTGDTTTTWVFAAPTTNTVPRTTPDGRHPGDRLMRHFGAQTVGQNVYLVDGVASISPPSSMSTSSRVFHGGHTVEVVTEAEAAALTAGGFTVIDTNVLLADAVVYLAAGSVSADWAGEDWVNQGTGGAGFDASLLVNTGVTFTGTGFRIPPANGSQANSADDGFTIPDTGALATSMDTAFTVTLNFTPMFADPVTCRYLRKYTGANIIVSGNGLIVESTAGIGFIAGVVSESDGATVASSEGASFIGAPKFVRHSVTLRVDRTTDRCSVFRDGSLVLDRSLAGQSSVSDPSDVIVGPGQTVHGVAWWDSALSDNEILAVHAAGGA